MAVIESAYHARRICLAPPNQRCYVDAFERELHQTIFEAEIDAQAWMRRHERREVRGHAAQHERERRTDAEQSYRRWRATDRLTAMTPSENASTRALEDNLSGAINAIRDGG
jgi:hypothetical protein